jgi:TolA-binding protein
MDAGKRNIALEKKIDAYIKGFLSEEEVQELWAELIQHPEYVDYLKTEIDIARFYQSERGQNRERPTEDKDDSGQQKRQQSGPRKTMNWWWISIAAAVILFVIGSNIFLIPRKDIHQWAKSRIGLTKNLASAPVTRSAVRISRPDSLLNAGFKAAIDGKIQEAMDIYRKTLGKYNDSVLVAKANLNLGILRYNDSEYKAGIHHFSNAVDHAGKLELLKERAYWYMANAYINIHHLKQARAAVYHALSIGKIYKKEEYKLLDRLGRALAENKKTTSGNPK